ncbi:MAG: PASTA domain-containing protein [Bifidobacteriaceae bacterium]|nr:PASTA domain-containing protein [Bifidobacteriaceae bacterium]
MTLEEAEAAAASFDLTVVEGAPEYSETVPEGQIIAQSPDAGGQTQRGAAVTVVISLGMPFVEVPKLSGLNWDEAVAKLAALGLEAKRENLLMALWGSVYYTDPAEGTSVRKGSTVTLYMV